MDIQDTLRNLADNIYIKKENATYTVEGQQINSLKDFCLYGKYEKGTLEDFLSQFGKFLIGSHNAINEEAESLVHVVRDYINTWNLHVDKNFFTESSEFFRNSLSKHLKHQDKIKFNEVYKFILSQQAYCELREMNNNVIIMMLTFDNGKIELSLEYELSLINEED